MNIQTNTHTPGPPILRCTQRSRRVAADTLAIADGRIHVDTGEYLEPGRLEQNLEAQRIISGATGLLATLSATCIAAMVEELTGRRLDAIQLVIGQLSREVGRVEQRCGANHRDDIHQAVPGITYCQSTLITGQGSTFTARDLRPNRDSTDQASVTDTVQLHIFGIGVMHEQAIAIHTHHHVRVTIIEFAVVETDGAIQQLRVDHGIDTPAAPIIRLLARPMIEITPNRYGAVRPGKGATKETLISTTQIGPTLRHAVRVPLEIIVGSHGEFVGQTGRPGDLGLGQEQLLGLDTRGGSGLADIQGTLTIGDTVTEGEHRLTPVHVVTTCPEVDRHLTQVETGEDKGIENFTRAFIPALDLAGKTVVRIGSSHPGPLIGWITIHLVVVGEIIPGCG